MGKLSEDKAVEKPVTHWLSQMGWKHRSLNDLKVYQRSFTNPIIEPILIEKVASFNGITPEQAKLAVEQLTHHLNNPSPILGNETFLEKLTKGITQNIEGEDRDIHFIDFEDIWQNDFTVTNQYWVEGAKMVKTDIMLLVNGVPLVPIEAKQRAKKGTNWLEGVRQFSTYDQRSAKLFMCHAFGVACNGRIAKYGIPGASSSYFNEWKETAVDTSHHNPILDDKNNLVSIRTDENGVQHIEVAKNAHGDIIEKMKLGIIGLLQPARVLDMLKHFLVFERTDGKVIKKVARYQQLRAANKIADRVVNSDLKQGVVWHTQGSGKSLTMLYTAYKLRQEQKLNDPTVYIVVDRKDLREQIGGTFDDCEFPNARPVNNIGDLKHVIRKAPAGVFITTIQKFRELGEIEDKRENVIILIDEAHRTQYGDFQIELQSVLPNAKRFAFTGTPIPKTHQEFGVAKDEGEHEHYLDKYGIQDAIEDGATVPIRYTFGPTELHLDKEKLKQGYAEITADLTEDEKKLVELRTQPWKTFLKHPDRIEKLANDIHRDFREQVEPQGYKAQVVACDKEACVLYFNALIDAGFDRSEVSIIFSTGNYEESEKYEFYKDHYKEDKERKRLIKQFKKRITEEEIRNGNNLKVFIVCNMLLTGFDAPIEQTMYLDSPIRDHNLLQAVARTNRPYDDQVSKLAKEFGRIVDYVGVFTNYKEALNYDPDDIGEFQDVESLMDEFPDVLAKAFKSFGSIKLEDSYECAIEITRKLSELDQGAFEQSYREVVQLWEAISPHPKLRDQREKYLWLNTIYEIYLEEFKRLDFDAEIYAQKTRKLIEESTTLIDFKGHLPEVKIDGDYLKTLRETKLSAADKAEKIIRDIETVIRQNEVNSAVYVEFQVRLDELIRKKQEESLAIEDILTQLGKLYTELDEVATLPQRLGFEDKGTFEIFTLIKNEGLENFDEGLVRDFAKQVHDQIVKQKFNYTGWQDIPNEPKRLKTDVEILAASDEYLDLGIDENGELMEKIQNAVVSNYSLK